MAQKYKEGARQKPKNNLSHPSHPSQSSHADVIRSIMGVNSTPRRGVLRGIIHARPPDWTPHSLPLSRKGRGAMSPSRAKEKRRRPAKKGKFWEEQTHYLVYNQ